MFGWNWDEIFVVGLIAACVLGPICIVLMTRNLMGADEEFEAEHFDFNAIAAHLSNTESSREKNSH